MPLACGTVAMGLRRNAEPPAPPRRRVPWSSRIAFGVLVLGGLAVVARVSIATVVQIHGDGMAPNLVDRDHVVLFRSTYDIGHGDIVVYDPTQRLVRKQPSPSDARHTPATDDEATPDRTLQNTAVVDAQEIEENWERIQRRAKDKSPSFRVGRVLARPGDEVVFNVESAALGLVVNGEPLEQKPASPQRVATATTPKDDAPPATLRSIAYESIGDRRYTVIPSTKTTEWVGMELPPPEVGPVEVRAEGFLVLADNRDEGACCDSRKLGWIPREAIRGELVLRFGGDATATPDVDPAARRLDWL